MLSFPKNQGLSSFVPDGGTDFLALKAEGPVSEVYHIKDEPAHAFGCLGRRQDRGGVADPQTNAPTLTRHFETRI
jgi:hypothetical protein